MLENSKLEMSTSDIGQLFDCVRYIDQKNYKILKEISLDNRAPFIPAFDYSKETDMLCSSSLLDKAIYRLEQEEASLLLYATVPTYFENKEVFLEYSVNITKRADVFQYQTALDNIYKLTITDDLTNIFNRRYMNKTLPIAIADCLRQNKSLSAIFIDLDSFKKINDFYGHAAGDCILREFAAELLTHICQKTDWVARYGGDEFFLCLPGLNYDSAKKRAENIRIAIEKKIFYHLNNEIKITCSLGIYTSEECDDSMTTEIFLNEIDKRLFWAKRSGKNNIS